MNELVKTRIKKEEDVMTITKREVKEGVKISAKVIVEELIPGTDIVVSREEGENIICHYGADAITNGLDTGTIDQFNYMAISTDATPAARATGTIPGSLGSSKFMSTVINPTVDNTTPTSKITWVFTFTAAAGRTLIAKFGMEKDDTGSGHCWNEYVFSPVKDNTNNDLKITYVVSVAP